MLRLAKLTDAEYVLDQVAGGLEDYYLGSGEAPGVWAGRLAEQLELAGIVQAEDLRAAGAPVTVTHLPVPAAPVPGTAPSTAGGERRGPTGVDPQLVRAWAREQGRAVADRGRVSEQLVRDYRAAHGLDGTD